MNHPLLDAAQSALSTPLAWTGDLSLLDRQCRAVLVSRTKKNPAPDTAWVLAAGAAVKKICASKQVLAAGWGRLPYDLALWTSKSSNGAAVVALSSPPGEQIERIKEIAPERHLFVWPQEILKGKESLLRRDLLLAWLAGGAYAIYVRPGGNMAAVKDLLLKRNCPVEDWPLGAPLMAKNACKTNDAHLKEGGAVERPARAAPSSPLASPWDFLTHFTREPQGAWPGETQASYLGWLGGGSPFAPRDGFAALVCILREKRLRACGDLLPESTPMVCFSALLPEHAGSLRRWRKGLARWTVSPYGLAIRKGVLVQLGAQGVRYVSRQALRSAPSAERCFLQLTASTALAWTGEAEWRVRGDVDLSTISFADMLALVKTQVEAQTLSAEFGIKSWQF